MILVGFSGYGYSGKDSCGEALIKRRTFTRAAFADEVRTACLLLDPLVRVPDTDKIVPLTDYLRMVCGNDWNLAKKNPEVRRLLQRMGTELGRQFFGEDIWIRMLSSRIEGLPAVAITDVRFWNEADWIKAQGGIVIRVHRPGTGPILMPNGKPHYSEVALDGYNFNGMVVNDRTLEDLEETVVRVCDMLLGRRADAD